jgi:hypothetical protein
VSKLCRPTADTAIHESAKIKDDLREADRREVENEADIAVLQAKETAEIERTPGGKAPSGPRRRPVSLPVYGFRP